MPGYQWRGAHDRSAKIIIEFEQPEKVRDTERYRAGLPVVVGVRAALDQLVDVDAQEEILGGFVGEASTCGR